MEKNDLIQKIITDYKSVKHPGYDNLVTTSYACDADYLFDYEGISWEYIPFDELDWDKGALFHLTDKGLLYVLPAYLTAMIEDEIDIVSGWWDILMDHITSLKYCTYAEPNNIKLNLTSDQIDCIFLAVEYLNNRLDNQNSVCKHCFEIDDWNKRLKEVFLNSD